MNWKYHIAIITAKAQNCRHFLQRNLTTCNKETKLQCYKSLVRPIIEYATTVWDPVNNNKLKNQLEMVQRKSARWICNKWQYSESPTLMIKELNLKTLEQRRKINQLAMLYELYHGQKYMPPNTISRQRCNDLRFKPIYGIIQSYTYSFYPDTIRVE